MCKPFIGFRDIRAVTLVGVASSVLLIPLDVVVHGVAIHVGIATVIIQHRDFTIAVLAIALLDTVVD
jgi:hypothetical protein